MSNPTIRRFLFSCSICRSEMMVAGTTSNAEKTRASVVPCMGCIGMMHFTEEMDEGQVEDWTGSGYTILRENIDGVDARILIE